MANKTYKKVSPVDVREYWVCDNEDCKERGKLFFVNPDFYQDNGTLTCECGDDCRFDHVEVKK